MSSITAWAVAAAISIFGMPACGHPKIWWAEAVPGGTVGYGHPQRCVIYLQRDWAKFARKRDKGAYCGLLIHEWGHVAGLLHSPDPGSFMHNPPPRC